MSAYVEGLKKGIIIEPGYKLITDFEGQGLPDPLNLVMGMLGGIGKSGLNLGKSGSKIIDELRILEKIKARNLKGLENLRIKN